MTQVEILSGAEAADFTEIYYDLASDGHFWLRWRFRNLLTAAKRLGLDPAAPMLGLDIGCGNGVVQQQLAAQTAWRSDGCDLNRAALARHQHGDGRVLYYDIHDCRPELRAKYDFLVLFDVIEHIAEPLPFLTAAAYHLKPGGYAFINVPACQSLFSQYDAVQGHHRRYDKKLLRQHLAAAGLTVCALRYWGMFLLPALLARKLYVDRKSSPEEIYRAGFRPPNQLMSALLSAALAGETFLPPMPLGTSLLAVARKPG